MCKNTSRFDMVFIYLIVKTYKNVLFKNFLILKMSDIVGFHKSLI